jgi:hypothetical protein
MSDGLVQRIGHATAVGTTTLWVPARLLRHSSDVRLVSALIGSTRSHTTWDSVVGESGKEGK